MNEAVLSLPTVQTSETCGIERRARVRFPSGTGVFCQAYAACADPIWWPAQVQDILLGSIGLILCRRFEVGTVLSIEVRNQASAGVLTKLVARVRHVTAQPNGGWKLGCELLIRLTSGDLEELR
jgi:hypothetical protein